MAYVVSFALIIVSNQSELRSFRFASLTSEYIVPYLLWCMSTIKKLSAHIGTHHATMHSDVPYFNISRCSMSDILLIKWRVCNFSFLLSLYGFSLLRQ